MCTVTYIPAGDKFFIASNRDEKIARKPAVEPRIYLENGKKLIYPRDSVAGGSWIALHENGNTAVLLNGAFEKHVSAPPYRMSRGKIFLDIISNKRPLYRFYQNHLPGIEPFTIVLLDQENLYECRWDGKAKHSLQLKRHRPYIWSSVTLYTNEVIKQREQWFAAFLNNTLYPSQNKILGFHQFAGGGDIASNLLMKRDNVYATVSITSIMLTSGYRSMKYIDTSNNEIHEIQMEDRRCREFV